MAAESPTRLRIELARRLPVFADEREVPAESWRRSKALGVVKLLALAPAHRRHREQVMDVFWPELDPGAANLRKALHHARRAVGDGVSTGDVLALPADRLAVDVVAWRATVAEARGTCYIEFGAGRVGRVDIDFLSRPTKQGVLHEPSAELVAEKAHFGSSRRERWFGGIPTRA